jgi:hypothetical protein
MPPTRSRVLSLAVATTLAITGGLAAPAAAADSPEGAVNQLLDAVEGGDTSALDTLVCEAERDAVREMLDPGSAMGMEGASTLVTFQFEDRDVELIAEDSDEATVNISGTMSMNVSDDDLESVALALLDAEGEDYSEEDLAMMMPFMEMALTQTLPLDEEVTVIVEDGGWVVCGGLGEPPEEPDYGFEPTISTEGICALASPDELSALGPLEYDGSTDYFDRDCSFSTSDFENYHQVTVSIEFDTEAENVALTYGADQPVDVGGSPAWAPGPDGFATSLITQAGSDTILVIVSAPETPPESFDWLTQATLVTELIMPRLAETRVDLVGPTPEPTPEVPLCPEISLDELNEATGLGLDEQTSDAYSCQFVSADGDPGYHFAYAYVNEIDLETYKLWIGEHEEATVAGLPALVTEMQTVVELPGGTEVLDVTVSLDAADEAMTRSTAEVGAIVAEYILGLIE